MNRNDYMDLLRDYLKAQFTEEETEDIIRDYEEYFEAGLEAGKTELEIMGGLGSPKKLVKQLAEELHTSKKINQMKNEDFLNKVGSYLDFVWLKLKKAAAIVTTTTKETTTNVLKETDRNHFFKKVARTIFRIGLFFVKCMILLMCIPAFITLFIMGLSGLALVGLSIPFFGVNMPTGFLLLFIGMILGGITLIGYEIARLFFFYGKIVSKRIATWWDFRVKGGTKHE